MSSYSIRDWVTVGLFGALWGVVEATLGSALHAIYPPLANTFLTGVVLGGIGAAVALTGRHFVPRRGSVLLIAVVTATTKLLSSPAGARIGPVVAILAEGALMEAALWAARSPRLWTFVLGGALAVAWNLPHKFLMMRFLQGQNPVEVYNRLVQQGSGMLGIDASAGLLILAILMAVRLIVGGVCGWSAWALGKAVARRLGQRRTGP